MTSWVRTMFTLAAVVLPVCAQQADHPDSSLVHLRAGEALFKEHNFQAAAIEFTLVAKGDGYPVWTLVWSYVDSGRVFDATGQRIRAIEAYNRALNTNDDSFDALGFARLFLQTVPAPDDPIPTTGASDSITPPTLLTRVEPEYSAEGLLARLEGSVLIAASISADGAVSDLKVSESLGIGLDEAALSAVRQWTFAPAMLHGQPVPAVTPVRVPFRLSSRVAGWHVTKIQFAKPDAVNRPVLVRAGASAPGKMSPELAEEASIDVAMSRVPSVSVSMEIGSLGNPEKIRVDAASLPLWGDDAVNAIGQWRFSPSQEGGTAIAVPCVMELAWYPPQ